MRPFELQVELRSPLILPNYPLSLDGLLYWALRDHADHDQAMKHLDTLLASESGCFKASAMAFVRTPWQDVTSHETVYSVCIDVEDTDLFMSDARKQKVQTNGGPYRKRQTRWNSYLAAAVAFHAVGNPDEVAALVRGSVSGLGKNHRRGAGRIGSVAVVECDTDWSWKDEHGRVARTLPEQYAGGLLGGSPGHARYRPRYDLSDKAPCLVPNAFRSIYRESISI